MALSRAQRCPRLSNCKDTIDGGVGQAVPLPQGNCSAGRGLPGRRCERRKGGDGHAMSANTRRTLAAPPSSRSSKCMIRYGAGGATDHCTLVAMMKAPYLAGEALVGPHLQGRPLPTKQADNRGRSRALIVKSSLNGYLRPLTAKAALQPRLAVVMMP